MPKVTIDTDAIEDAVRTLLDEFDPLKDDKYRSYSQHFTEEEWNFVLRLARDAIERNARLALFARAVGDAAVQAGMDETGNKLAREIAFEAGPDACSGFRTFKEDDIQASNALMSRRLTFAETNDFDNAEGALVHGAMQKALRALDTELAAILDS